MELLEAIKGRRAVRSYADTPVARETIEELIGAAVLAPSAMNSQPWAFGVVTGREMLLGYSDRAKAALLAIMDQLPALERYRARLSNPDFNIFHGAPALVVIYAKPGAGVAPETDCALAAQNLMLAARGQGIGSCWIGFARVLFDSPELKRELGVPAEYRVVAPIILGYPKGDMPAPTPRNAPEMLFWVQG
ncbi:MAG TPA: nitroreductase [Chloroflexota bacterium]|nr:nitroreductase [Chloroflexota bacterium]